MPTQSSPNATPVGMPGVNNTQRGKYPAPHFDTVAEMVLAAYDTTSGNDSYSADQWRNGLKIILAIEPFGVEHVWSTSLAHARTVLVGGSREFVLGTNTSYVRATSGAPANNVGADGDGALDKATGLFYGPKAGGVWPAGVFGFAVSAGSGGSTPDAAINYQFTTLATNVTQSGDATAGYNYSSGGRTFDQTPSSGPLSLPANVDGWLGGTTETFQQGGGGQLSLTASEGTLGNTASWAYTLRFNYEEEPSGGPRVPKYQVFVAGTSVITSVLGADAQQFRIRLAGTSVFFEYSNNNWATSTNIYTATGQTRVPLYPRLALQNGDILVVRSFNFVSASAVAPGAVTGVTAGTATSTTQPLTWTAPTTGTTPFTYTVGFRLGSSTGAYTQAATNISGTSYTVTGLTASTAYDYSVTANNVTGTPGAAGLLGDASTAAGAPAATNYRFTTLAQNVTETGDATAGWNYASGGRTFDQTPSSGPLSLAANATGWLGGTTETFQQGGGGQLALSDSAGTLGDTSSWPYSLRFNYETDASAGGARVPKYEVFVAGTSVLASVLGADDQQFRIRPSGTSVFFEFSSDNWATAGTVIYTATGQTRVPLYPRYASQNGTVLRTQTQNFA